MKPTVYIILIVFLLFDVVKNAIKDGTYCTKKFLCGMLAGPCYSKRTELVANFLFFLFLLVWRGSLDFSSHALLVNAADD